MKSKSLDSSRNPRMETHDYDFVNLYKSAAETDTKLSDKRKSGEGINKENDLSSKVTSESPKRERSPYKNRKKSNFEVLDVSQINIDGQNLSASVRGNSSLNDFKVTSTPISRAKTQNQTTKVKSIMKNTHHSETAIDSSNTQNTSTKRKKRNKSVSFMLEDNEETVTKKTKSDDTITTATKKPESSKKGNQKRTESIPVESKKVKVTDSKKTELEKENKPTEINQTTVEQVDDNIKKKDKKRKFKMEKIKHASGHMTIDSCDVDNQSVKPDKKKKVKKIKKRKTDEGAEPAKTENTYNEEAVGSKDKKKKKKKHYTKQEHTTNNTETEEEHPKQDVKPDLIADDLENLSIGDNAHTLTNLLDEMTVIDKNKKKKNKRKSKGKKEKTTSTSSSETTETGKTDENKDKLKWRKRKWNKDKNPDEYQSCLLVENLPLTIMFSYKKLLAEHFGQYGNIKKIGIAEVYSMVDSKPVFSTTVTFNGDDAATKALAEDNTLFEGNRIRVKRSLPPTETTLVVRSYGELSEQVLSSVFTSAGRIRSIRHVVKGKKSMATAFIEFDGPEAVERAFKMAEDAKIGGKKLHVSRFEKRNKRNAEKKVKSNAESENEGDSEDSND